MTKTMRGADCWTGHRLVVSKLNLCIQPVRRSQGKKVPKKLDVSKLKPDSKRQAFVNDLCSRLDALEHSSEDEDESWTVFRDSKTAYSNICKTVQTRLRDMQDSWLRKKVDEIQSFADRKEMKKLFDALKTVYGPQGSGTTPLLSADGTNLLTDKEAILKRWAEHFDGVLNRPSSINDEAINRLPQVECNPLLDELPTVSETVKAIKLLSSGKAPGSDAIPAEIYKAGGPPVAEKLTELFHIMWRKEAIP